ncbi:MAG: hypothetical protein Q8L38_12040 [Pseudohongiella sp.]|nr:hypothetical protein [Pseudohongiella sp.]
MDYIKKFLIICFILLLAGCSTLGKKDKVFEAGYRVGVKENIEDFAKSFYGNDFPYFYWSSPVVQNVQIPAHIKNGVFIPDHFEPVVIEPAEWRNKPSYPINCPKGKKEPKQKEGGEDYAFNYLNFSVRDITVLPESFTCVKPGDKDKDSR